MNKNTDKKFNFDYIDILFIIGIVIISLIIGLLAWCITFNIRGQNAFKVGDYETAHSFANKNVLFGKALADDCLFEEGNDLFKKMKYEEAAEIFLSLGDRAHNEWADCIYEIAEKVDEPHRYGDTWEKDFQNKIDAYKPISDEERAKEKIAYYTSEMAEEYYYEDEKDTAYNLLNTIDPKYSKVSDAYDSTYLSLGDYYFSERDMEKAKTCYSKTSEESAKDILEFLSFMDSSQYEDAAKCVIKINDKYSSSERDLRKYMEETITKPDDSDIDARLEYKYIFALLDEKALKEDYSSKDFTFTSESLYLLLANIGILYTNEYTYAFDSLEDVYNSASNPNGKILVLKTQYGYPKGNQYIGVDFDLMKKVPASYYPRSLSEVEYVIIVNHDYSNGVSYSGNGKTYAGLIGSTSIKTTSLPDLKDIYKSATVYGKQPGSTNLSFTGSDGDKFVPSYEPDYSQFYWNALKSAMDAADNK